MKIENITMTQYIVAAVIGILSLLLLIGSIYTVDQGERAVVIRTGAVIGSSEPGLHFKLPIFDKVARVSVQSHTLNYEGMQSYSKDQQPATIKMSVTVHASAERAQEIYATYGSLQGLVDRIITPRVFDATKKVFGGYTAASVIQERSKFGADVYAAIVSSIDAEMNIDSVQIENIDFSDAYETSVEQRMLAEVEVQKVKQNWEKEKVSADIVRTKAQAEADATLAKAEAEAKAIILTGNAEASAIKAKGASLRDNPSFVDLTKAERWNGVLPTTMPPNSTVPFLSIK